MFGFFASIGTKLAASFIGQKAKDGIGFLREVPRPVWEALAVVGYALALYYTAHQALKQADQAGYDRRAAEDAKTLAELRTKVKAATDEAAKFAQDERNTHAANLAAIHASAAAISLSGPGAASCGQLDHPAVSAPASGHPTGGTADAAVDQVPADQRVDLIGLPFADAVSFGADHDALRDEVISWHVWYPHMVEAWNKLRAQGGDKPVSK